MQQRSSDAHDDDNYDYQRQLVILLGDKRSCLISVFVYDLLQKNIVIDYQKLLYLMIL